MKLLPLPLLLLLFFVTGTPDAAAGYIDLPTAVAAKKVDLQAMALGGLGNDNLSFKISNKSTELIEIKIPAGLHFKASGPSYQDLLTAEEMMLAIKPGASTSFSLHGFCMNASNMSPESNSMYSFNGYAQPNLKKLAGLLAKAEPVANSYGQMFVWALTDKREMYPVSVPKEFVEKTKEITKFVSTVSSLPDVSVTASTGTTFTPTVEVFSKSTVITFHNPTDQVANFKMYDKQGKELHTFYSNRKLKHGVAKYEVGINHMVPFNSSPEFTLKVTNSAGRVLAEEKINKTTTFTNPEPELVTFVFDCTLKQAVKNASLRVYLENGTLVEEMSKYAYLPIGNFKIKTKLLHLYPKNTVFIAKMEGADGKVHHSQTVNNP